MQVAYLAISLVVLGGNNGPETQAIHQGFYDKAGCIEWKANMDKQSVGTIDRPTGRALLSQSFVCQPVDLDHLQGMIDSFKK